MEALQLLVLCGALLTIMLKRRFVVSIARWRVCIALVLAPSQDPSRDLFPGKTAHLNSPSFHQSDIFLRLSYDGTYSIHLIHGRFHVLIAGNTISSGRELVACARALPFRRRRIAR